MTDYSWASGKNGDWGTVADWTPEGTPNAPADNVHITAPGTYTVTISAADLGYVAGSVTLASGHGTLAIASGLTMAGSVGLLEVTTGEVLLESEGVLADATIALDGGSLALQNDATLSGDSLAGRLQLNGATVYVVDGLSGATIGRPAIVDLLASGSDLDVQDIETIDNATLLLGSADLVADEVLTLGTGVTVTQAFGYAYFSGQTIINEGSLLLSNGVLSEQAVSFTNAAGGTIALGNGETLLAYGSFDNAGIIDVAAGTALNLTYTSVDDLGSIDNAGVVDVGGTVGLAGLSGVTGTGLVNVTGTLDLGGGTLDVKSGQTIALSGDVVGGSIKVEAGGSLSLAGATLDGITYLGTLAPSTNATLYVVDGLVVESAVGALPGTIDLTGISSNLEFQDIETLDHVTLLLGGQNNPYLTADAILTLGPDVTGTQMGGSFAFNSSNSGEIINQGVFSLGGGTAYIYGSTFVNAGTISLLAGESVFDQSYYGTFDNVASGIINIGSGSTFNLNYYYNSFSNEGSIAIAAGGTLIVSSTYNMIDLAALGSITGPGLLEIAGTLDLGGGTLDVKSGENLALINDVTNGTIKVESGGSLSLNNTTLDGITYLGTLAPSTNTTLYVVDGLAVETAAGDLPGTIDLTGNNGSLEFQDIETLDHVSLLLGGQNNPYLTADAILTLGPDVTGTQTGGSFVFNSNNSGEIINQGVFNLGGGTAYIYASTFANAGTISLLAGESVLEQSYYGAFDNEAGGVINIGSGATLNLDYYYNSFSNEGSIAIAAGGTLIVSSTYNTIDLAALGSITGSGLLEIAGTLDLGGGTLDVGPGENIAIAGEVTDGTIKVEAGGSLSLAGATLNGITILGTLAPSANATTYVENGLTVKTVAGGTPGTIALTAPNENLIFADSETLSNMSLLLGGQNAYLSADETLTLDTTVKGTQAGGSIDFYAYSGGEIINEGSLNLSGGTAIDQASTFDNVGTLALSGGENFQVDIGGSFINDGVIQIGSFTSLSLNGNYGNLFANDAGGTIDVLAGGNLQIATDSLLTQSGLIEVAATGTVEVATYLDLTTLGSITGSGTLVVDAGQTLDLDGGTLQLGAGTGFSTLLLYGEVTDGTIAIAGTGAIINQGSIDSSVTVSGTSAIGAAVTLTGYTNLAGGTLDIARGTADSNVLLQNGILYGGTLKLDGGIFTFGSGATIYGMTVLGALATGDNSTVNVTHGLTVKTLAGATPGSIQVGDQSTLNVQDSETWSNLGITLGSDGGTGYLYAASVLTLAGTDLLTAGPGNGYLYGAAIVNDGKINDDGVQLTVATTNFTNAGTYTISGNDIVQDNAGTFSNTGSIAIAAGGTLNANYYNMIFDNTGTIGIASGGTLEVGTITLVELGTINAAAGAVLVVGGSLNLGGGTLDLATGSVFADLVLQGTIADGTIVENGATIGFAGNPTLDGVTLLGALDLADGQSLNIIDGLTVKTLAGGTTGTISLGNGSIIYVLDTETLSSGVVILGSDGGQGYIDASATWTIGSAATLTTGIGSGYIEGDTIVNDGKLNDGTTGLTINTTAFINAGTYTITGSDSIEPYGGTFTNTGTVAIATGGTLNINDGSQTSFDNTGVITVAAGGTLGIATSTLAGLGTVEAAAGAVLAIDGSLDLGGGTLSLTPGTAFADVLLTGTIADGTIVENGATLGLAGNPTLDGVTLIGALQIGDFQGLNLVDGFAGKDSTSGGLGSIVIGKASSLTVLDTETLSNAVITFNTANYASYLNANNTLTLADTTFLTVQNGYGYIDGNTVINDGQISDGGKALALRSQVFTNAGTITVDGTLTGNDGTFSNAGTIVIGADGTLDLSDPYETFDNAGVISIAAGGTLVVGSIALAELGTIAAADGAVIDINGSLDLGGGTLDLTPGSVYADINLQGTIANGTVVENGAMLDFSGSPVLDGVTLVGPLESTSTNISLVNSFTVTGTVAGTPGVIDLSRNSNLYIQSAMTLDKATILSSVNGTSSTVYNYADNETLTLGHQLTLTQTGGNATFYGAYAGDGVVNNGVLSLSGGAFSDYEASFINAGTIELAAGETFYAQNLGYADTITLSNTGLIEALANAGTVTFNAAGNANVTFSSLTGTTLTAGGLLVGDGSTLDMTIGGTVAADAASITLDGPNSALNFYNADSGVFDSVESDLLAIKAPGTLALLDGRAWTGSHAISDAGLLQLGGGVFTAPSLNVTATGHMLGFATLAEAVANSGTVEADGGTLTLTSALTGTGVVQIDAASALVLQAASTAALTFEGIGSDLILDKPASYTGTLTNLAAGNTITLMGEIATSASTSGTVLTVDLQGGGTQTYSLSAASPTLREAVTLDGLGNSELVVYREGNPALTSTISFGQVHAGDSVAQYATLANTAATDGYSEALDAQISAAGSIQTSGSIALLAAGGSSSTALLVTEETGSGGHKAGIATVALQSDGAGVDGLPPLALSAETINVSGDVFNYATASVAPTVVALGDHHVGDSVVQTVTLANTAASGAYSENLDAGFVAASGHVTGGGTISELAAGVSSTALGVTLATSAAGAISGTATLGLVSDGAGIDSLGTTALATQTVALSGDVFNYATASVAPTVVALGDHHVGDSVIQTVTLANTAASGVYSENLDAGFVAASGHVTGGGTISELAAGASSAALGVTLATSAAGAISGTATLGLVSDGAGIDSLGTTALASKTVTLSADVFNYANAMTSSTIVLGDHHVGDSVIQALTLANTAASGAYSENLDAGFVAASGHVTGGGTISELAAGASSAALGVTLATSAAGAISGSATLGLVSDGTGIDSLGTTALANQVVNVSGAVFNYATASVAPTVVALGDHHVGDSVIQALTLANTAASGAYSENLDAGFVAASGHVTGGGTISELAAGASSAALGVTLATSASGAISGTATLGLVSDGAGIDSLGTTALTSKTVTLSADVFNYATAMTSSTIVLGDHHVGDSVIQALTLANTAASGAYSENLDAGFVAASGHVTGGGTISELAAGASSAALGVTLATSAAGAISGTATLGLVSDGAGIDSLGTTALANQVVNVSGAVFNYATASLSALPIDFGIVHVGDNVAETVALSNAAAAGGYSEALDAGFLASTGGVITSGSVSGLGAQASSSGLSLGLSTASAGAISGNATLGLVSDGTGIDTLGTTALGAETIAVSGTVNNYAVSDVIETSGSYAITRDGPNYVINLGTVQLGEVAPTLGLGVENAVSGPADLLSGLFDLSGATAAFTNTGFTAFANVAAEGTVSGFTVSLDTSVVGEQTETIILNATGSNSGGYSGALAQETITITGDIACFAEGTLIRTASGGRLVETLRKGDLVLTNDGRMEPIVWLGRREVHCDRYAAPEDVYPVLVTAHAFGENVPARDLLLSPDHAVFTEGVLIPVKYLVNGQSVRQIAQPTVTYFHVELPQHEIILAEGLPVESYLDAGNRMAFANTDGPIMLRPLFGFEHAHDWAFISEALACAPMHVTGPQVEAARRSLATRLAADEFSMVATMPAGHTIAALMG